MAQSYFQDDEILGKAYDARLVRRLWVFVRPYHKLVWVTVLVALSQSAMICSARTSHRWRLIATSCRFTLPV